MHRSTFISHRPLASVLRAPERASPRLGVQLRFRAPPMMMMMMDARTDANRHVTITGEAALSGAARGGGEKKAPTEWPKLKVSSEVLVEQREGSRAARSPGSEADDAAGEAFAEPIQRSYGRSGAALKPVQGGTGFQSELFQSADGKFPIPPPSPYRHTLCIKM